VASARAAFESGVWSALHPTARKLVLCRLADLIMENVEEPAVMEALDAGKPVSDCLEIDVPETANCIRWHAEAQDRL
jgi:gamma-glutamyl-gamma-aminobutyraldehyde dehydrogenase